MPWCARVCHACTKVSLPCTRVILGIAFWLGNIPVKPTTKAIFVCARSSPRRKNEMCHNHFQSKGAETTSIWFSLLCFVFAFLSVVILWSYVLSASQPLSWTGWHVPKEIVHVYHTMVCHQAPQGCVLCVCVCLWGGGVALTLLQPC